MNRWTPSGIIYQVNLRGLAAREPRNAFEAADARTARLSPLAYVTRNLDYVAALGANVLYLMPPFPIGFAERKGIGSPYSIRNFRAIEPEYGAMSEMKALVRKAHRLGLKVIFDITPNHSSRDNVWVREHPEFYVKRENGDIFYDADWSDTAKLDYTNPALRAQMLAIYDYWLGFLGKGRGGARDGIDGFRLDMAHFINDKSFWDDAMPELKRRHAGRELLFLAECYGIDNNLDLFARGINAAYDDDFYKVCANLYGLDASGRTAIVPAHGLEHNDSFRDRYDAFRASGIAGAFARAILNYEEKFAGRHDAPLLARYTDNHDEGRGMYLYGEGAVRAVNALAFMAPHTLPFILTGEEFGALNRPPIHDRMNPIGKRRRILRADGSFQEQESVEFEGNIFLRDPRERLDLQRYFKSLIRLRLRSPELVHGSFKTIDSGESCPPAARSVLAFDREWKGRTVRCAVNLGPDDRRVSPHVTEGKCLFGAAKGNVLPAFHAVATRI